MKEHIEKIIRNLLSRDIEIVNIEDIARSFFIVSKSRKFEVTCCLKNHYAVELKIELCSTPLEDSIVIFSPGGDEYVELTEANLYRELLLKLAKEYNSEKEIVTEC